MSDSVRRLLIGAVALTLLLAIHFVTPQPGGLWLRTFYDSLHVPVFGAIAVGILFLMPVAWSELNKVMATLAVVTVLAALSEIAQVPTPRDASLKDFVADLFGAVGFLCIAIGLSRSFAQPGQRRLLLVLAGLLSIALPLIPLASVSAVYVERSQRLPSLIDFGSRSSELLYHLQTAELVKAPAPNDRSAVVILGDGQWPGIAFTDLWPDWGAYDALVIELENPASSALPIGVRIHDRSHRASQEFDDRFNLHVDLEPGRQTLSIDFQNVREAPATRQMNLAEIDGLILFATREQAGRRFVIHDIRLAGDAERDEKY